MRLGVLFSGGKDSTLALHKAVKHHNVACLITLLSKNSASFMFQSANVHMTELQSVALGIPRVVVHTQGEKELELLDLERAIIEAKQKYNIEGIVTGAVRSTYQASRIQQICLNLGLWCFNPLWLRDQVDLLNEIVGLNIRAMISGVFAEPLDESFLGREIDGVVVKKLAKLSKSHGINAAGEGGEIETTVLDAPLFKKRIEVKNSVVEFANFSGVCAVLDAELVDK